MLPVEAFLKFCRQNKLAEAGQHILAAVSGGKDSVLMAHLLNAAGFNFGIAHVNFQLRGEESERDETFVQNLAGELGVPFYATRFETKKFAAENKLSVQMAARQLRYKWFEETRRQENYNLIATAHHLNDQLETLLLNLVRGTGLAGLHGIAEKKNQIIRPLLFLTRAEIDGLILSHKIPFVEDSSNTEKDYARNKMRLDVVPKLAELNQRLEHTFARNARRFRQSEEVLGSVVLHWKKKLVKEAPDGSVQIDKAGFFKLEPLQLLAFELLKPFGFTEDVTDNLVRQSNAQSGTHFFSPQFQLSIDRDLLMITARNIPGPGPVLFPRGETEVSYAGFMIRKLAQGAQQAGAHNFLADEEKLIYPLTIRPWQKADSFKPTGLQGSKKLSDFFTGQKISIVKKAMVPLLVNGDGCIIWVCGYRGDRRFAANASSRKVVIFELTEHRL